MDFLKITELHATCPCSIATTMFTLTRAVQHDCYIDLFTRKNLSHAQVVSNPLSESAIALSK